MKVRTKQSGLSLMEEVVVVAAIALLVAFGIPAIRALFKSLESETGTKAMISGALSTARAIAAKEQHYAGVRFQYACYKDDLEDSPFKMPQYMIFIIHDPEDSPHGTNLENGFKAVDGFKPIRLPDSVGVMDLIVSGNNRINLDSEIDAPDELNDTTTFSVIFSPSGRLIIHNVKTRNRKGDYQPSTPEQSGYDDVFNSVENIENNNTGQFVQDDYPSDGFDEEPSRKSFVIYERDKFKEAYEKGQAWTDYLEDMASQKIFINPYTGTMIEK